ncbi:small integral membrane protein 30-like [Rhinichthys klamathensis goyatoka]|uniref:small integral membrane protein 30-like n=1 Tax=Rhinichthys klamathensis goyatoka TaxID=3034132 RepID=UPI0024B54C6B|nr:small integral membrane protein 30-like [Rhinichthys klamathensis goyatoka]
MAPKDQHTHMVLWLFLLALVQTAEAFDGGDALALLLGATVTLVGICACLGWYARTRNGQF